MCSSDTNCFLNACAQFYEDMMLIFLEAEIELERLCKTDCHILKGTWIKMSDESLWILAALNELNVYSLSLVNLGGDKLV